MRGRLAPSPTGRLHLGNLSSLLLAALQVRAAKGTLIYRVEDLDPPRCVEGAELEQQRDLAWLGVEWDEGAGCDAARALPFRQSERRDHYLQALEALGAHVFPCFCSRRDIRDVLSAPHSAHEPGMEYPGTCHNLAGGAERAAVEPHALRCLFEAEITHSDGIWGPMRADLRRRPGAFVVRRRDGLFAYQLAVAVDDAAMGVTDVLRGVDLLDSTPRQLAIHDALGSPRPRTWHVPLLVDARGERLSKRAQSVARDGLEHAGWTPATLRGALATLWGWADTLESLTVADLTEALDLTTLRVREIRVPDSFFDGPSAFAAWLGQRR